MRPARARTSSRYGSRRCTQHPSRRVGSRAMPPLLGRRRAVSNRARAARQAPVPGTAGHTGRLGVPQNNCLRRLSGGFALQGRTHLDVGRPEPSRGRQGSSGRRRALDERRRPDDRRHDRRPRLWERRMVDLSLRWSRTHTAPLRPHRDPLNLDSSRRSWADATVERKLQRYGCDSSLHTGLSIA